jgi:hypothetical protein
MIHNFYVVSFLHKYVLCIIINLFEYLFLDMFQFVALNIIVGTYQKILRVKSLLGFFSLMY